MAGGSPRKRAPRGHPRSNAWDIWQAINNFSWQVERLDWFVRTHKSYLYVVAVKDSGGSRVATTLARCCLLWIFDIFPEFSSCQSGVVPNLVSTNPIWDGEVEVSIEMAFMLWSWNQVITSTKCNNPSSKIRITGSGPGVRYKNSLNVWSKQVSVISGVLLNPGNPRV